MKRTLLLAAMAAVALTSCTKDQVVDVPQNEIGYKVVTDNTTKASAVYGSTNPMGKFVVYAEYSDNYSTADGATITWRKYFAEEEVEYNSATSKWETVTTRYWPSLGDSKAMRFYAVAGVADDANGNTAIPSIITANTNSASWSADGTQPVIMNFSPKAEVKDQEDLLYSVKTYSAAAANNQAALNFRHALSQIQFRAQNVSDHLYVTISDVYVGNVASKGTFTFPAVDTDVNWVSNSTTDDNKENNNYTTGTWKLSTTETDIASYSAPVYYTDETSKAIPVPNNSNIVNLTVDYSYNYKVSSSMLLLPTEPDKQTVAWDPADNDSKGTFLAVKCDIYNVAGDDYDSANDVLLHSGWAKVPVSFEWKPGKRYIYTFVFGNGNGGYDGGEDPEDPSVEPVLIPIDYIVTVDDFDKVVNPYTPMETK